MKILGNTVGNPTPRTDWNQKDPNMADYLKGRDALEMLIQNAQDTADDNKEDIAELTKVVGDKAETETYKCTLLATGWSDAAPFTQTVPVEGLLSTDYPLVDIDLSDVADATPVIEDWTLVGRVTVSGDNKVTAYCFEEAPEADLPVVFKVVR